MSYQENAAKRAWNVRKTIRGVILPFEQDEEGDVILCSIITDDDEEFEVFDDPKGQELCEHIDEEVIVQGIVRFDEDGPDRVRVDWFRPVEWHDDAEADYDSYDD